MTDAVKKEYYVTAVFPNEQGKLPALKPKNVPWAEGHQQVNITVPVGVGMSATFSKSSGIPVNLKGYVYVAELTEAQVEEINGFGMYAVVDSPRAGPILVVLREARDLDFSTYAGDYKHIIQVVDTAPYEAKKAKAARRIAIKKHLDRLAAEARERIQIQDLLAGNAEAAALFEELKGL